MMDSTNVDIKAIKEYMLSNFSGLDQKRLNKLESAVVSKNNSKKYDANPGMDFTEACVAVLMALEDPVKYNLDNILDRFDALPEPAKSHSVAFADHVKMISNQLMEQDLISEDDLKPIGIVSVMPTATKTLADRAARWFYDQIPATRFMSSEEMLSQTSFYTCVAVAQAIHGIGVYFEAPIGTESYSDISLHNQKLEALFEIGIKHSHDISGLAAVISPESILNLYNKHYKELDKVLPLINEENRFEVASYLYANGEKRAFEKLIPAAKLTPSDKKHINELTGLLYDLNKHAESLFKEADSSSILPTHTKVIDAYSETNELVKPVINQIERGKMNYELFDALEKTKNKFQSLKEQYINGVTIDDEPKSFFAYMLSALIAMFKTKISNEIMNDRIDRALENFNTVVVAKAESREESTTMAVSTTVSTEIETTAVTAEESTVKGKHVTKEDEKKANKQDQNIVHI